MKPGEIRVLLAGIAPVIAKLEARVAALEQRSFADVHRGVFAVEQRYQRGDIVTRSGALWLALQDIEHSAEHVPGRSTSWRLIVKSGGRDVSARWKNGEHEPRSEHP